MHVETPLPLDDWRAVEPAARAAEAAGFDGLTVSEIDHDPFVPLALAALVTERVRLGTATWPSHAVRRCWPTRPGTCTRIHGGVSYWDSAPR